VLLGCSQRVFTALGQNGAVSADELGLVLTLAKAGLEAVLRKKTSSG
jgi:hypothetical protein